MASVTNPLRLPDPSAQAAKKKIDVPYNRWQNKLRRAIISFIKITLVISVIVSIISFASIDDVSLNLVLTAISTTFGIVVQIMAVLATIVLQFGLIFWYLGKPKVDIIRPGDNTMVTFDDYWGQPQLVRMVKQWMYLLRDRKEYEKMGGKYISGLLLYGPPGTGKTMLAKAIAGESGMAFLSSQGTSFQGMFWGMDILKVMRFSAMARELAKKYGACVAYIDEIDAIGMSRGGVRGGNQGPGMVSGTGGGMGMGLGMFALSTLLSQMDGINMPSRFERFKARIAGMLGRKYTPSKNWHVMWMGSTNRPEVLDPALTRSGRLDTKIEVGAPDRASRRLIIQGYLNKIQYDDTVDIEAIVADTNGMTPADISSAITKDSVRLAFFEGHRKVGQRDIDRAFMEQQMGMEMPVEEMDIGQKRVLAYHEAGHAIVQYYVMPDQKIVRATIVRLSTGAKGHVLPVDTVEQHIEPVQRYVYDSIVSLAGRASEKILTGEIFNSVGGDYMNVQRNLWLLARTGYFGPAMAMEVAGDSMARNDKALEKFWLQLETATDKILRKHWREVTALAEELMVKSTLSGKEVVATIEANQSPDAFNDEIVPKTLAAIRAQTLAETRAATRYNGGAPAPSMVGAPAYAGSPAYAGAPASAPPAPAAPPAPQEDIVVINGATNGPYQPQIVDDGSGRYNPQQAND